MNNHVTHSNALPTEPVRCTSMDVDEDKSPRSIVKLVEHVCLKIDLWIFYVFVLSCVCYVFVRVCLYVLCGHLLGKAGLLALVCGV